MRFFISFSFSNTINQTLKELQSKISLPIKFTKDFHLTLLFIGDLEDHSGIIKKLKTVKFKPFEISLSDLGVFPSISKPRVLWVGLENNESSQVQTG